MPKRLDPRGFLANHALAITLIGLFGFFLSYVLRSSSTYTADSVTHYLIAHWSWKHPELLFDVWGRPGFTIPYSAAAQLGLTATHVFSSLLAVLVCALSAWLAQGYGLRWPWLAAVLVGLQPEFTRQAVAALTELACALYLILALLAHQRQRWTLMAIAAGLMPLARYETLPLLLFFLIILARQRRPGQIVLALAPLLLWNSFWAVRLGDATHLLFPFDQVLFPRPGAATNYASGPPWHYILRLPVACGGIAFVLSLAGGARLRPGLAHLCAVTYVAILSVGYWLVPAVQIAGYDRHLAVIAPIIGVFALAGLDSLGRPLADRRAEWLLKGGMLLAALGIAGMGWVLWRTRGKPLIDGAVAIGLAGLVLLRPRWRPRPRLLAAAAVVAAVVGILVRVDPFVLVDDERMAMESARWYAASEYRGSLVLGATPWFPYAIGIDPYDRAAYRPIQPDEIDQAPVGSVIVWDSYFSDVLMWRTPLSFLQDQARFQPIQAYHGRGMYGAPFDIYMFVKVAP